MTEQKNSHHHKLHKKMVIIVDFIKIKLQLYGNYIEILFFSPEYLISV